ncbi:MAG: carboxypeptidase-like regulatory domain-containing protein, partial [Planctomycetota bacterium]
MKIRVAVTCAVLLTCIAAWCVAKCGGAGPVDLEQSSDPGMVESGNEQTEPKPEGALAADGTERKTLPSAPAEAEGAGEPKEPDDPGAVPGELLVRVTWKNDNKPAASIGVHVQPSGAAGAARTAKRLQRGLTTRSIARLAMTGADGVARLQLLPGKFVVGVDRAHTTKTVEVEARETAVASFALDPGIDVNGLVVDPFDNPVPGADIVAFRQHPGRSWLFRLTRTDKGGRFRLRGVMAYYQRIGARTREHGTSDFFMMVPGKAEPGEATFLRLKLPGVSATLRGVVRGATGQPLADAWVKVGSQETRLPGNAVTPPVVHAATDAQGRFQFDALRPGEHTLRVFAAGHAPYRQQVQCHGIRPAELTIQLQRASTLRGRVLDEDGRPVSKTHVELRGVEWPAPSSARPDEQGRFEIGGLPARQLQVLVFRDGTAAMSTTVELPVAGTAARDFVLSLGHLLQGILVDERGTPLVGWRVYHNSTDKSIPR